MDTSSPRHHQLNHHLNHNQDHRSPHQNVHQNQQSSQHQQLNSNSSHHQNLLCNSNSNSNSCSSLTSSSSSNSNLNNPTANSTATQSSSLSSSNATTTTTTLNNNNNNTSTSSTSNHVNQSSGHIGAGPTQTATPTSDASQHSAHHFLSGAAAVAAAAAASSLPHQLSQFCNSPQNHLLALQQNFNHILPNYFEKAAAAAAAAAGGQPFNSMHQNLTNSHHRNSTITSNHHHHHNNHSRHQQNNSNQLNHHHHHNHQNYHHHSSSGGGGGNGGGGGSSNSSSSSTMTTSRNSNQLDHYSRNINSICSNVVNKMNHLGSSGASSSGGSYNNIHNMKHHNSSSSNNLAHQSTARNSNDNNSGHDDWRNSSKSQQLTYSKPVTLSADGSPPSLLDLSAKVVAEHIPFQSIEQSYEHIPEPVQKRIIYWSFPRYEEDIKMYSSLSNDTFNSNGPTPSLTSAPSGSSNNNSTSQSPSSNNAAIQPLAEYQPFQPMTTNLGSSFISKANSQRKQLTFSKGLSLYNEGCVQEVLQIGFNLSGEVVIKENLNNQANGRNKFGRVLGHASNNNSLNINIPSNAQNIDLLNNHQASNLNLDSPNATNDLSATNKSFRVSVTFDRCKITSVSCSCELQDIFWCEHVVALILYRIRNPEKINLRIPISETLLSLDRQQLQKLVQYLIAEHHTEVLPTAQRLLDEMSVSYSVINQIEGAPDPTAGACADDEHIWHLDEQQVNEKVQNYLNLVFSNSKDAIKQINALFEKIREMFRAKDSNGTRLLTLITEQFLLFATRNEKSRSLWDQLAFLWVVVMLNPDLTKGDRKNFVQLLTNWSKVPKCPKEDFERRVVQKRKAPEISDDEDAEEPYNGPSCNEYPYYNRSNNIPAHMANHRHRSFPTNANFSPVLKQFNYFPPAFSQACAYQLSQSVPKKMRVHNNPNSRESQSSYRPSTSSNRHHQVPSRPSGSPSNADRAPINQEPRSVLHRALDMQEYTWDDPHLQLILNKDGPSSHDQNKSYLFDFAGNPLWDECISQAAARIETLRSHGYREQALRLTVATVRRLKQDQWYSVAPDSPDSQLYSKSFELNVEGWIGHPFDPINVMLDLLLESSLTEANPMSTKASGVNNNICSSRNVCSCSYNQALADLTQHLLPDLATLSYPHRLDFPMLPLVDLAPRRSTNTQHQSAPDKTPYYHVPVPGCCQKDSYLTLAFEIALIALGQQRPIATIATAHERAVRQEAELISKLESIDSSDPMLMEILKNQTEMLLKGGPFHGYAIATDSAPLHTYARYLFDSLVGHFPQLAYNIGVYALKMPLLADENGENFGAARTSPRSINNNHLLSEQLALAQAMLSRAKDEAQPDSFMKRVYRASTKNIRNPASLLKLSKHALKEAKPSGGTVYRNLLETAFNLGLHVLKLTREAHTSNTRTRKEAITFIVECATDLGVDRVLKVMRSSTDYFTPTEALSLVVCKDTNHVNMLQQAIAKLKPKGGIPEEGELSRASRDLVLVCASLDPKECALDALKFCETHEDSLKKALETIMMAGKSGTMKSAQLIEVADHIDERGMTDKAFEIALVAIDSITTPSNSDSSVKNDIFRACEYAKKVNGFSTLIPKLNATIDCAIILSEIYHRFCPNIPKPSTYSGCDPVMHFGNLNYGEFLNLQYQQRICWDELLKHALDAFVNTTRTRLQNISPRHYGEFIDFLVKAQSTFGKATNGPQQFKDLISEIMKSYRTKKKLMERLKARFDCPIKACV